MGIGRPRANGGRSWILAAALSAVICGCGGAEERPAPAPPPDRPLGARVFPMDAAPVLDDPGREAWQRPDEVIAALAVRPGQQIADVGCGTGYFTLRLLRAAAPGGRVIAVDIQQGMLDLLEKRLGPAEKGLVVLRKSPPDRPLLPGDAVDLVLCANTLHEVDDADQARFVESMAAALGPGGRLAAINWLPSRTRLGPPVAQRISQARMRELAAGAGLTLAEDLDILPMHSFLVFRKPK